MVFGSLAVLVFFSLKSIVTWWLLIPVLLACAALFDWVSVNFDVVQPPARSQEGPRGMSARRFGFLVLVSLAIGALLFTQIDRIVIYKRYLADNRPPAKLDLYNLTDTWTEQTLRQAFPGIRVSCYRYTETGDADRVCALDSASLNGIPTLYTAFFFSSGRLSHASINVPWWSLADARHVLVSSFGPPTASQLRPHKGLRLEGWQLRNGSALFINRDRPLYPLEWNAVLWNSKSTCSKLGCFRA